MSKTVSTSLANVSCLCGGVSEAGNILTATTFPIQVVSCSCETCRHSTGALCGTHVEMKSAPSPRSLALCSVYRSSEWVTRYFCSTCGAHVYIKHDDRQPGWSTLGGNLERSDQAKDVDTIKIVRAEYLDGTRDGGLVGRMNTTIHDNMDRSVVEDLDCFARSGTTGEHVPLTDAKSLWHASPVGTTARPAKVSCSCHCGDVQFYITPPNSLRADSPKLERWLRQNKTKYVTKLCFCRSCSLATGVSVVPWTYVMPECIFTLAGTRAEFGFESKPSDWPGARVCYGSGDSKRSFCGTCGATLFYECEDRPEVINISLGLFRSETGVLAEDIMEWDWQWVSWKEDGRDHAFLRSLTG